MDLQTAIAASMLPASKTTVAAAFKDLRHEGSGTCFLELLWATLRSKADLSAASMSETFGAAGRVLEEGRRLGIDAIPLFDARYPALLACTGNPPPVLWARGLSSLVERRIVAVVGSRAASAYALQVAGRLGRELAERGVVVASGLARGVDSAAHRGCLEAGGPTIAIQGCGLDRTYPSEHADLADKIATTGLLLSELGPGAPPLPAHFPLRNRIISGISLATVIVEASERSGSLITARYALEQGRDVMAVPGSVLSGRNRGSHALLKDGAKVVETADDILEGLGWNGSASSGNPGKPLHSDPLLAVMDPGEPYELDDLASMTGMTSSSLLTALTQLELRELVVASGGKFIRRT